MARLPAAQQYIGKGVDLPAPDMPDACCNPRCDAPAFDLHHIVRRSYLNGPFDFVELFGRVWLNLAQVCRSCHDDLEQNRTQIAANLKGSSGYYSWAGRKLDPYLNPVLEDGESAGVFPPFHAELGSAGSPSSSTGVTEGEFIATEGSGDGWHSSVPVERSERLAGSPSVTPGSTCPHLALKPGERCPDGCGYKKKHTRKATSPNRAQHNMWGPIDEAPGFKELAQAALEHTGFGGRPYEMYRVCELGLNLVIQDPELRGYGRTYLPKEEEA